MSYTEFKQCAEQRGRDYAEIVDFVSEQVGDAAEGYWQDYKSWFDSLDDSAIYALTQALAVGRAIGVPAVLGLLGAVMTVGAAELLLAVILGFELGILIDLLRVCGDQL